MLLIAPPKGKKRSGQLQLTAKKRGISNGNTKRSMTVSRFLHDYYNTKEAVMQKGKGEHEHGCVF